MLQVITKSNGWITVTPRNKNRKRPIEKQALGNVSKVNVLSPVWMQVEHKKPPYDGLKAATGTLVKEEANRTVLVAKT